MTVVKILKNVSGATRNVLNRELADSEAYTVPYSQWTKLADHQPTLDDIQSGVVVINNGSIDLSISEGLRLVRKFDLEDEGRPKVQLNGVEITPVADILNFTGAVTVIDDGNKKATINITAGNPTPRLREVTYVLLGGTIPMNIESVLLFELEPINDTVLFLSEIIQ